MRPNCSLSKLFSGAPEIVFGDLPSTWLSFVYLPLSIAATAVTTLNVEPGGYWPERGAVQRARRRQRLRVARSRRSFGSNDGVDAMTLTRPVAARARRPRPAARSAPTARRAGRPGRASCAPRGRAAPCPASWSRTVVHAARLAGQLVVARLLEAEAPDGEERVADGVREQARPRVAARVRPARARRERASAVPSAARMTPRGMRCSSSTCARLNALSSSCSCSNTVQRDVHRRAARRGPRRRRRAGRSAAFIAAPSPGWRPRAAARAARSSRRSRSRRRRRTAASRRSAG